jgi:hypothetical protein
MAARHLLAKLEARGWIVLPPRRGYGGRQTRRVLQEERELFARALPEPIMEPLSVVPPGRQAAAIPSWLVCGRELIGQFLGTDRRDGADGTELDFADRIRRGSLRP